MTMAAPTSRVQEIREAVGRVEDPELPITIKDLGMVRSISINTRDSSDGSDESSDSTSESAGGVVVDVALVVTYSGCPAQYFIERDVKAAVADIDSNATVNIVWESTPWSTADVTDAGRVDLADVGVAVPSPTGHVNCPYCGSNAIEVDSIAGSSLCRSLAFCTDCRNTVDILKAPGTTGYARSETSPVRLISRTKK